MSGIYDEDGIDGPFERGMSQPIPRMQWEVLVPGFQPIPVRDREIAEIVRKKLARIHGTLAITIQEKR